MLDFRAVRTRVIGLAVAGLLCFLAYCAGQLHAQSLESYGHEFIMRGASLDGGGYITKIYHLKTQSCFVLWTAYSNGYAGMAAAPKEVCK